MKMVFEAVRLVAPTDATVLILGDTGTGKELVARAVHELSDRSRGPFVTVNCAALPEGLLESELFGHVRGSFTGAVRDRTGLFQAADSGTIFLDEVGDISATAQQRLLRVLQERELKPVGAVRSIDIDVRVIAATNRNLRADVETGRFREDLFYRLNVFRIELPALRERRSDIPLLVEHWLDQQARRNGVSSRALCSPFALRMLQAYEWPGNVRELFAVLESACIRAGSTRIEAQHLPAEVRAALRGAHPDAPRYRGDDDTDAERAAIQAALDQANNVRSRAAELLGMGRTTLWRKMRLHGLLEANGDVDDS
jgi:two-component system response regulator HydG